MKIHVLQNKDGGIVYSSVPIVEDSISSTSISIDNLKCVQEGSKEFEFKEGKVCLIDSDKKQIRQQAVAQFEQDRLEDEQKRNILKEKLRKKTATLDDIQEALFKII